MASVKSDRAERTPFGARTGLLAAVRSWHHRRARRAPALGTTTAPVAATSRNSRRPRRRRAEAADSSCRRRFSRTASASSSCRTAACLASPPGSGIASGRCRNPTASMDLALPRARRSSGHDDRRHQRLRCGAADLEEIHDRAAAADRDERAAQHRARAPRVLRRAGLPTTPEIDKLRRKLYELEDRDAKYRDFWAEFNWYRRYGTIGYADPVPASTEQEYLKIDIDLPKEYLELFFRLEADRMANAVLRGWEAQRFTVLEQILNGLSRPKRTSTTPSTGPRPGPPRVPSRRRSPARLRLLQPRRDVADVRRLLRPNNATLALVGDVDMAAARALGERYFGRVPRGPEPSARLDIEAEPVPRGTIRLDWAEPLDSRVVVRYRVPGVGHPDRPVFDTIAALPRGRHGLVAARLGGRGIDAESMPTSASSTPTASVLPAR